MRFTDEQLAVLRELAATTKVRDLVNRLSEAQAKTDDEELGKLLVISMFVVNSQMTIYMRQMMHFNALIDDYGELVNFLQTIKTMDGNPVIRTH